MIGASLLGVLDEDEDGEDEDDGGDDDDGSGGDDGDDGGNGGGDDFDVGNDLISPHPANVVLVASLLGVLYYLAFSGESTSGIVINGSK